MEQSTPDATTSITELWVSKHAAERYQQRMRIASKSAAIASIRELLKDAEELELKRRWRTTEVLNHRDPARFFRSHRLVFVVVGNVVKTVHDGAAKRWRRVK